MDYLCQQEGETVNTLSNYQVISSPEEREERRSGGGGRRSGEAHNHTCVTDREHEQKQGNRRRDAAS